MALGSQLPFSFLHISSACLSTCSFFQGSCLISAVSLPPVEDEKKWQYLPWDGEPGYLSAEARSGLVAVVSCSQVCQYKQPESKHVWSVASTLVSASYCSMLCVLLFGNFFMGGSKLLEPLAFPPAELSIFPRRLDYFQQIWFSYKPTQNEWVLARLSVVMSLQRSCHGTGDDILTEVSLTYLFIWESCGNFCA